MTRFPLYIPIDDPGAVKDQNGVIIFRDSLRIEALPELVARINAGFELASATRNLLPVVTQHPLITSELRVAQSAKLALDRWDAAPKANGLGSAYTADEPQDEGFA